MARTEKLEQVHEACRAIVEEVKQEDGCLDYHRMQGADDKRELAWFERWRDGAP